MTDALLNELFGEDAEFLAKVEADKTGLVYEQKDADGKRVTIVNLLVEQTIRENESLRYLRFYTRTLYDIQRLRISAGNQRDALERMGVSESELDWIRENVHHSLDRLESTIERRCKVYLDKMPIWTEYLKQIKGVGPRLASSLVSIIVTPKRFPNTAKLWKYAGLGKNDDGSLQRRKAGQQDNWSADLKMTIYKFEDAIIKTKGGYRNLYDQFKAREVELNEQRPKADKLSKGHVNQRARRRVGKLFLAHLLEVWRTQEGLPVRKPYPIQYLGHETIIPPFTDTD